MNLNLKDGLKRAINKILKHRGCIIADSVGLGNPVRIIQRFGRIDRLGSTNKQEQATAASDFELITWLVIKSGGTDG